MNSGPLSVGDGLGRAANEGELFQDIDDAHAAEGNSNVDGQALEGKIIDQRKGGRARVGAFVSDDEPLRL